MNHRKTYMEYWQLLHVLIFQQLVIGYGKKKIKTKPKFWALENPQGRLHKFIGQPLYKFYQYEFGGKFYKPTWIWGEFNPMIIKGPINKNPIKMADATSEILYQLPGQYDLNIDHNKRAAQRSIICEGFAKAFYDANK